MDDVLIDYRQMRGLEIAKTSKIKQIVADKFLVPSQSQTSGGYIVDVVANSCSCPDHELRGTVRVCKHRWAVRFVRHQVMAPDGSVVSMRISYTQLWSGYNAAQTNERDHTEVLLRTLCDAVETPRAARGRPRLDLGDLIFAAATKAFVQMSGRRAMSDIRGCTAQGLLSETPHYNSVFLHMSKPEVTPVLRWLLRVSATPLASVETGFAIDGSGFSSNRSKSWIEAKYKHRIREAKWIHLHAIFGTRSNVITTAEVTSASVAESPLLPQLVQETAENFDMRRVLADKGYLSRKNVVAIDKLGAEAFIPMKINSTPDGPAVWTKLFHLFSFHRETFLESYGQRSNAEAGFSALKRKFGGFVRAKLETAMFNEILTKCILHNLSCVVRAMYTRGLEPEFQKVIK